MPDEATPAPSRELKWAHRDTRGLQAAGADSFVRAIARNWQKDQASVADLRALVLNTFVVTATLGWTPPSTSQGVFTVRPNPNNDRKDFREVQDSLMLGLYSLLARDPASKYALEQSVSVETEDGVAPERETGVFWLPAVLGTVAIVVVTGAIAAVVSDWLDQQNQIDATKLATDANAQKLASSLATANQIVESHLDREYKTGQTIPWDPQELDLLATLKADTKALAEWKAPGLRPAPIAGGAADMLGGAGHAIEKAGTGAGIGAAIAPVALILGGLYLLNERERKRAAA